VKSVVILTAIILTAVSLPASADPVAESIGAARQALAESGPAAAVAAMEPVVADHPDDPRAHAWLGWFHGIMAGQATGSDWSEAGRLVGVAFEHLDRAVELDSAGPDGRYFRGVLGIQVPDFFGRLESGVTDLETFIGIQSQLPCDVTDTRLPDAHVALAAGYQKTGNTDGARHAWEMVIETSTDSADVAEAAENLARLADAPAPPAEPMMLPDDPAELVALGRAFLAAGEHQQAADALRNATALDSANLEAFRLLATAVHELVSVGYDGRIVLNTDLRANLAFEYYRVLDRAVTLAPDDVELRLWRGAAGIHMPFFVGKLDIGIEDLELVAAAEVSEETRAEALYLLGVAHRRKGMHYWTEVVGKHGKSEAAASALAGMRPTLTRFDPDQHAKPVLSVDFILGFRDELEPQVAVWIEDSAGAHVRTLYVSGFSGHAKDAQVDLPAWTTASGFAGCDGVTGASIDLGHHIYTWDLTDVAGARVAIGRYEVKVEAHWWPSMKYQLAAVGIETGPNRVRARALEQEFIPFLEATYYPE